MTRLRLVGCAMSVLSAVFAAALAAGPRKSDGPAYRVKAEGEMRTVMLKGDLAARADTAALRGMKGLYALGPVEGLKGEVTVFDGKPSIATVRDGKPSVGEDWPKACFLVSAQVVRWGKTDLPKGVESLEHLQAFVEKSARAAGLDVEKPFPFLVTGTPKKVKYHIVWKTDGLPHTKELHAKAKVPFEVEGREVQMLGFHSDKHHGVFTHHDTNIHVHFRTADGKDSGHVDATELAAGMSLHLPKP
jgi:acetolactate decarboxylase